MNPVNRPVFRVLVLAFCGLAVAGAGLLISTLRSFYPASAATALVGPVLSIPEHIPADPGEVVSVPVNFTANGTSIASVIFSIDYDQIYLSLAASDPYSITVNLPPGFEGECIPDLTDVDGEIDCTVYFPNSPFQAFPENYELAVIRLLAHHPSTTVDARVGFSSEPPVSFGNTGGFSEPGSAIDGSVLIPGGTDTPPDYISYAPLVLVVSPTEPPPTEPPPPTTEPPCYNLLLNSSFEDNTAWEIPLTDYPAAYSIAQAHTGARSMRTGIDYAPHNRTSFSDVRQQVTIPNVFMWVRLNFWRYAISNVLANRAEAAPARALPPRPEIGLPFGPASLNGYDVQYVQILDTNNNLRETLVWMLVNQPVWIYQEFMLNDYAGQTIKLQFGTYNDGYPGAAAMYVDDVELEVCQ